MNEDRYHWDEDTVRSLRTATQDAHDALAQALTLTTQLMADMQADSGWSGEHKVTFLAWMDLVHQYHSSLAADTIGPAAVAALDDFLNRLSTYYQDSETVATLRGVG
jgi:uncharacterized protein YukE